MNAAFIKRGKEEKMAEFVPITTKEQFEEAVKERVSLAVEECSKKYEGFSSPDDVEKLKSEYDDKIKNRDSEIAERDAKIRKYETGSLKTRIAHEMGLDYDAAGFIQGEDEEAIRKSAEALKALMGSSHKAPPLGTTEPSGGSAGNNDDAYRKILENMEE